MRYGIASLALAMGLALAAAACSQKDSTAKADKPADAMAGMKMDGGKMASSAAAPSGPMSDDDMIKNAMSAGPDGISKDATVVVMSADGKMRQIRAGTNGFTCMPDDPSTPGNDPMCGDKNALEWLGAFAANKTPTGDKVGFMYMLQGGVDPSNIDPRATKPAEGHDWIKTPPHVMVLGAPSLNASYPKGQADPDTTKPYVMWAGTPYEHLMIPVK